MSKTLDWCYAKILEMMDTPFFKRLTVGGYSPVIDSILDEDDMATDSDTALATQQSIKAYVDDSVVAPAPGEHKDTHDPEDGDDPLDTAAPSELASVQAAAEGSSHSFARADHQHQIQHSIADNHILTVDGTIEADDVLQATSDGVKGITYAELITAVTELIQDLVGGMVTGNTETNITVTYQDDDGTIDFVADGGSSGGSTYMATGVYTGDGTTSQAITGLGFSPDFVRVWTSSGDLVDVVDYYTSAEYVDDDTNGLAIRRNDAGTGKGYDNTIISLDTDGFTVDDNSNDAAPNSNGDTYYYVAWGAS